MTVVAYLNVAQAPVAPFWEDGVDLAVEMRRALARDRAERKNVAASQLLTTTRLSSQMVESRSGWVSRGVDEPTFSDLGLQTTPDYGSSNLENSAASGASVASNALPTGWGDVLNGAARVIVGTGTEDGLPYVDIRYYGTPTSNIQINFNSTLAGLPAAQGDEWTCSVFARTVAGGLDGVSAVQVRCVELNTSAFLAASQADIDVSKRSLRNARGAVTRTLDQAATNRVQARLQLVTQGQPIDVTLRVAAPNLLRTRLVLPPILNAGAVEVAQGTRPSIGGLDDELAEGLGVVVQVDLRDPQIAMQHLLNINGGAAAPGNHIILRKSPVSQNMFLEVIDAVNGQTANLNLGAWQPGVVTIAFMVANGIAVARMVGNAQVQADAVYPACNRLAIGGNGANTSNNVYAIFKTVQCFFAARHAEVFDFRFFETVIWPVAELVGGIARRVHPPASTIDAGQMIAGLWGRWGVLDLTDGIYETQDQIGVPAGRTLRLAGSAIPTLAGSSQSLIAVQLLGHGSSITGGVIDGNLLAREALGFNVYTHGVYSINANDVSIKDVQVRRVGETVADSARLNTGAFILDSDSTNSQPTTGGRISNVQFDDEDFIAPYGVRVRSEFIGYARGEIPGLSDFIIDGARLHGTIKNAVEIAGPNVHDGIVRNVTLTGARGQGGIETDYGPYNITFEDCDVSLPGNNGHLIRGFAAFSWRTSDQGDGKIKESSGNIARRCSVHDVTSVAGVAGLNCFHLISVRDSLIDEFTTYNLTRGQGASDRGMIGIYIETAHGEVHNIDIVNSNMRSLDTGLLIGGVGAVSGITVTGGIISAQRRGYSEPTATPLSDVLFNGGVEITADTPLALAPGRANRATFCDGAVLRGNQLALNNISTADQFRNTKFVLPPLGRAALETALPGITSTNGNSYERMPPGEAYLLRHENIIYDDAKAAAYKTCLDGLLADGILDKLDVLHILGAPFRATALQNTAQARFNASVVGSLNFAAGEGFSEANEANYLELAYNPSAAALNFKQNDAFMALWKGLPITNALTRFGSSNSRVFTNSARQCNVRPNASSGLTWTAPGDYEMVWWSRANATTVTYGHDDVTVGDQVALASAALTNANMRVGGIGGTTSPGSSLHRAVVAGSHLTVAQKETLRGRINTLLAALAA